MNDTTDDKATYTQAITVPTGLTVLANGEAGPTTKHNGRTTFRWHMNQPMASELAMIAIGNYNVTRSATADGLPNITAIGKSIDAVAGQGTVFNKTTARIVQWESSLYGRYPFDSTGGILADVGVDYAWRRRADRCTTSAPAVSTVTCSPTNSDTSGSATVSLRCGGRTSG
ncbi:hypothetical protein OG817_12450 [Kribbella sp. NBC_00889]|nr:hypothetical protein OG817_12450 [Kribbella sp. NBC_00889]